MVLLIYEIISVDIEINKMHLWTQLHLYISKDTIMKCLRELLK